MNIVKLPFRMVQLDTISDNDKPAVVVSTHCLFLHLQSTVYRHTLSENGALYAPPPPEM
jgi:hypothetical protein